MTLNHDRGHSVRMSAIGAILAIGAIAGCTPHPRPVPVTMPAPTTTQWSQRQLHGLEIRTEHWVVYTTTMTPYWVENLPTFIEACYAQYQTLVPAPDGARSLRLYVFDNAMQFDDFAAKMGVPKASLDLQSQLGGFTQRDVSAVYVQRPIDTLRAIAHAGMHQYLWQHSAADVPTWVSEGLATLAEGFDPREHRFVFEPRYNDRRFSQARLAIQKKWLLDLHTLLTLEDYRKIPNPDVAARTYLAELWTLVTFLQNSKDYQKGFEQLRRDIASDAFQLKLQGYLAAGKEPLSPGEAAFRLYITDQDAVFWQQYYDKTIQYLNLVR